MSVESPLYHFLGEYLWEVGNSVETLRISFPFEIVSSDPEYRVEVTFFPPEFEFSLLWIRFSFWNPNHSIFHDVAFSVPEQFSSLCGSAPFPHSFYFLSTRIWVKLVFMSRYTLLILIFFLVTFMKAIHFLVFFFSYLTGWQTEWRAVHPIAEITNLKH